MSVENSNLQQCLVDLGFSEREARVYLALLTRRHATSADLQKLSGVPQAKVYETVARLVRQGYCRERKTGRRRTFEIMDPKVTLAPGFQRLENRLQEMGRKKQEIEALYAVGGESQEPFEYIEMLHGQESIHLHYCRLVREADQEILGFGRPPYACDNVEKVNEQRLENEAFQQRGGKSRWIYEVDSDNREWLLPGILHLSAQGIQIRVAERLPLKMMIFDRRFVLVAQQDPFAPSGALTMAVIKQAAIANAYSALFEFFWQQAIDLPVWQTAMAVNAPPAEQA
ncbi:MAG: TrmB family transcriptional regulator [Candidatus Zixiibacteriota bacterium]|nr:MAG: TrmB family transcriptional regulator [candidate division Zixibacteria bacterium]